MLMSWISIARSCASVCGKGSPSDRRQLPKASICLSSSAESCYDTNGDGLKKSAVLCVTSILDTRLECRSERNYRMDPKEIASVFSLLADVALPAIAWIAYRATKQNAERERRQGIWDASRAITEYADDGKVLDEIGVTSAALDAQGLKREEFKSYVHMVDAALRFVLCEPRYQRMEKTLRKHDKKARRREAVSSRRFVQAVNHFTKTGLGFVEDSVFDNLFRTPRFEKAWHLMEPFWRRDSDALTAVLIEVSVHRGRAERKAQQVAGQQ